MAVADEGGIRRWGVVHLGLNDRLGGGEEGVGGKKREFLMSSLRFELRVRAFFLNTLPKTFCSQIHAI